MENSVKYKSTDFVIITFNIQAKEYTKDKRRYIIHTSTLMGLIFRKSFRKVVDHYNLTENDFPL